MDGYQGMMELQQLAEGQMTHSVVVPTGVVMLIAGLVIGLFGARLVRPALTLGFALAGAAAAGQLAQVLNWPVGLTAGMAAVVVGGFGYLTHRLWVGVSVAVFMAALAIGLFSYYRVLPQIGPFAEQQTALVTTVAPQGGFTLPDPQQQGAISSGSPQGLARNFWTYLDQQQAGVQRKLVMVGAGAALVGLLLGLVATRWALILCTSLVGTSLISFGGMVLASVFVSDWYAGALEHPIHLSGGWLVVLLALIALQSAQKKRRPRQVEFVQPSASAS